MKIHYFQRYHGKENVATANTMLLLSRLYQYSPDKFFNLLQSEIFKDTFEPEIVFDLQTRDKKSVPDATITQPGFKIVVETKKNAKYFDENQLLRHLDGLIKSPEDKKVIMTLAPQLMDESQCKSFKEKLDEVNKTVSNPIIHINTTFEGVAKLVQNVIDENRDYEMQAILDDYLEYCEYDGLISDLWRLMKVQLVGTTIEFNLENNVYYKGAERGFGNQAYLGLYANKKVQAIGKICARVTAVKNKETGEMEYNAEVGELTEEMKRTIDNAITVAVKKFKYNLTDWEHRYFFVEKFYETNFEKTSKGGLMGPKIFNLLDYLNLEGSKLETAIKTQTLPGTQEIADELKNKEW